jgi:hypothetical protein
MLQRVGASLVALACAAPSPSANKPDELRCVDHSRDKVSSPQTAPACWPELRQEIENGERLAGKVASLAPDLRDVPIETPRVTFKLCIDEHGAVRKAMKLLSSGNAKVDAFYCGELQRWRFRPKRVNGTVVPSVEIVTVSLHR